MHCEYSENVSFRSKGRICYVYEESCIVNFNFICNCIFENIIYGSIHKIVE